MLGFPYLEYLSKKGHLRDGKVAILDVGTQNLLNCSVEQLKGFVEKYRTEPMDDDVIAEIERLQYFSVPRPGERTLFLAELLALTDIEYHAIDVCPAPATEIIDLNWQAIPDHLRGRFDIVLNFGTLEHVIGQTNSLVFLHDALKVGGIFLHQPPSIGWVNHGYFAYHPQFFRDISKSNGYEIEDMWYATSGFGPATDPTIGHRSPYDPLANDTFETSGDGRMEYFNLNVVMRRVTAEPFMLSLELETSHSAVDDDVRASYIPGADGTASRQNPNQAAQGIPALPTAVRSDDELRQLIHLLETVPREDGALHPVIEAWAADFVIPYAQPETVARSVDLSVDALTSRLQSVGRTPEGHLDPEIERWLTEYAIPYSDTAARSVDLPVHALTARLQSVSRTPEGYLDPEIERWLTEYAIPYARSETLSRTVSLPVPDLLHQLSMARTSMLAPEAEVWVKDYALHRAEKNTLLTAINRFRTVELLRIIAGRIKSRFARQ